MEYKLESKHGSLVIGENDHEYIDFAVKNSAAVGGHDTMRLVASHLGYPIVIYGSYVAEETLDQMTHKTIMSIRTITTYPVEPSERKG
jgi:hypothetical protein